jgi:hypothetical protein
VGAGVAPYRGRWLAVVVPAVLAILLAACTSDSSVRGGVTLRVTIRNQLTDAVTIGDLLGPNGLQVPPTFDASGLYLYDGKARNRYDVVRDAGTCRAPRCRSTSASRYRSSSSFPIPAQPTRPYGGRRLLVSWRGLPPLGR